MNKTFKFFVDTTCRTKSKLGTGFLVILVPAGLFAVGFALLFADGFRLKPFEVKGDVKPRATHAELNAKQKDVKTDEKIDIAEEPIKQLGKIRTPKTESLIKRSAIISYGNHWTIVPKKAVLNVPKHLSKRVNVERQGKLLPWKEFYAKNRGWLQVQEVTIPQSRGKDMLPEGVIKSVEQSGRVVVAVCRGGPITVKRKDKEKETEASPEAALK